MKLKLSRLMYEVEQRIERGDTFRLALGLALLAIGGKHFRVLHNMMVELDQVLSDEEMIQDWKALEVVAEVLVSPGDSDIVMALNQLWQSHDATFQLADEEQAEREREAIEAFTRKVRPYDHRLPENKPEMLEKEDQLYFDIGLTVTPTILSGDGFPKEQLPALGNEEPIPLFGCKNLDTLRTILLMMLPESDSTIYEDRKVQTLIEDFDVSPDLETLMFEAETVQQRVDQRRKK